MTDANNKNRYHFIAIGGAVMHNLALALHHKGYIVTGSDDEIFDPARSRLKKAGILPEQTGWFPDKITPELDGVILGMHAFGDNPELERASQLGLPIFSFPEFIFEQTKNKKRVVIGGSHGKTTITSMIMHVLNDQNKRFDYLVGSQIEGFETMVGLEADAGIAVLEGDEYLSSALNPVPKFHIYQPNIAVISGIAWDHMNVFPTFENYTNQFSIFIDKVEQGGVIYYCKLDPVVERLVSNSDRNDVMFYGYETPRYRVTDGQMWVIFDEQEYPLHFFGEHNLQNMEAAASVCERIGIERTQFYQSIVSFKGAAKRLEIVAETKDTIIIKDFAHSPSKIKASIEAVKLQYPDKKVIALAELHTFSSLNKAFLPNYKNTMLAADDAVVFYDPELFHIKNLEPVSSTEVQAGFNQLSLKIFTEASTLEDYLLDAELKNAVILLMSSGNWNGVPVFDILKKRVGD